MELKSFLEENGLNKIRDIGARNGMIAIALFLMLGFPIHKFLNEHTYDYRILFILFLIIAIPAFFLGFLEANRLLKPIIGGREDFIIWLHTEEPMKDLITGKISYRRRRLSQFVFGCVILFLSFGVALPIDLYSRAKDPIESHFNTPLGFGQICLLLAIVASGPFAALFMKVIREQ